MSIQVKACYMKKVGGLPAFSSHSFMISVRAEVSSLRRLETESARLYRVLQESVDKQLQHVGFVPDTLEGMPIDGKVGPNGGSSNGHRSTRPAARTNGALPPSDKQKGLIEKVTKREKFSPGDLDGIAQRLFKLPLEQLDRKQTSAFITELLMIAGPPRFRRTAKPSASPAESVS